MYKWPQYSKTIFFTSFLSLILSVYIEITKRKIQQDKNFIPLCDYYGEYPCSGVLKSVYSTGFGFNFLPEILKISNSIYGIIFYSIIASLSEFY